MNNTTLLQEIREKISILLSNNPDKKSEELLQLMLAESLILDQGVEP